MVEQIARNLEFRVDLFHAGLPRADQLGSRRIDVICSVNISRRAGVLSERVGPIILRSLVKLHNSLIFLIVNDRNSNREGIEHVGHAQSLRGRKRQIPLTNE